jgi:sodium/bile acid cotransporter 7
VSIIFLVSGLQLSHEKLRMNLTAWRLHIIVQGISFVLIPVIMLGLLLNPHVRATTFANQVQ